MVAFSWEENWVCGEKTMKKEEKLKVMEEQPPKGKPEQERQT
jgi:hypothetical protein